MVAITPLYVGLLALLLVALAALVARQRLASGVVLGDGDVTPLRHAMRVQANFCEYVPLGLLVVLCMELTRAPAVLVHGFGIVLVVGRVAHAWGFSCNPGRSAGRVAGTLLTWAVLVLGGLLLVARTGGLL